MAEVMADVQSLPATNSLTGELAAKCNTLLQLLQSWNHVAVAFSAGVDSTVVAQAAFLALGGNAFAVTAVSPSLARGELEQAVDLARHIGIRHEVIHTEEFRSSGYQRNAGDRCYYCKSELYARVDEILARTGEAVVCNGANVDDLGDHRPGMLAATEHQVRSPLIECSFTKAEVRELARHWNLPVWDKPASPCLSSRIAYGVHVTARRVQQIDAAESFLRDLLDQRTVRVRLEANDLARIEVPLESLAAMTDAVNRERIARRFRDLGFRYITLDLDGFRSGSLNDVLPVVELRLPGSKP